MTVNNPHEQSTLASLSGAERAAVVLRTLGEDAATAVMRHMEEGAISRISAALTRVKASRTTAEDVMDAFATDLGVDHGGVDGMRYISRILNSALGQEQARDIIERLTNGGKDSPLNLPPNTDPRTLAMQMTNERPQTIALLLAHIPHEMGSAMLSFLPEPLATEALYRFSLLDVVWPGAVTELREMLADLISKNVAGGKRLTNLGGARQAADILNHLHTELSERVLGAIDERDTQTAGKIRDNLFTFVDLCRLPDRSLQIVMREVPNDRLAPALRLVDETVRARFFANMSTRMVEVLQEELTSGPPMRRADALAAQKDILDVVLRLAAEGKVSIVASEEMV